MSLTGRFCCMLGRHERSRRKAHDTGKEMVSVCRHCGAPMHKGLAGWRVDTS